MTADGGGNIMDSGLSDAGSGVFKGDYKQYTGLVYASVSPDSSALGSVFAVSDYAYDPDEAMVPCQAPVAAEEAYWASSDNWSFNPTTNVYTAHAVAIGDPTLKRLAQLITGKASDWTQLLTAYKGTYDPNTTAVPNCTLVDVSPLLQLLETRLRNSVVQAANNPMAILWRRFRRRVLDRTHADEQHGGQQLLFSA